ncbi:MAG: hypothetical protein HC838_16110 [Spirulinaceae cyanobacterium RM2_2_10]|nr:hypothetical protein [Spirulinaceae cyanobacterium SM2_1_0]NJO21257.1 hypothetical protein [Spirulinaceae cyanobacterium RM2_2_10]
MARTKNEPNRVDEMLDELLADGVGVDGLSGFSQAMTAVYPQAQVQLCRVHLVRNSLRYVPWQDPKAIAADLKRIDYAATLAAAETALGDFAARWDDHYPAVSQIWCRHFEELAGGFVPFCYPFPRPCRSHLNLADTKF